MTGLFGSINEQSKRWRDGENGKKVGLVGSEEVDWQECVEFQDRPGPRADKTEKKKKRERERERGREGKPRS